MKTKPIPNDQNRTPQQQAALRSMLRESVEFLFGKSSSNTNQSFIPAHVESSFLFVGQEAETQAVFSGVYAKDESKSESADFDDSSTTGKRKREHSTTFLAEGPHILCFRPYQSQAWLGQSF